MFDNILIPMDRSTLAECVLPHAVAMARTFDARLTLVHVLESPQQANWRRAVDPFNWRIRKSEAEGYLDDLIRRLQGENISIGKEILEGPAAEQIVELANKQDYPLIILSSHGQSGLTGWNLSSIAQKIVLRAHTSIMIVRAYQAASSDVTPFRYHRLLVPLDGSPRAEFVLPVASTLASTQGAEILLAHVARHPELPRQTPLPPEDIELAERLVARNQVEAAEYLASVRSRLSANVRTQVLIGDEIAMPLHELVDQEHIDLVLLSAHGHSGRSRWPYGSVVMNFLTFGTTALLIMQDLPKDEMAPTQAEVAAMEHGRS